MTSTLSPSPQRAADESAAVTDPPRSRRSIWSAVLHTPAGACSALLLMLLIALAVLAPVIWGGRASATDTNALSQGPSGGHLLGTDDLGRDIFYRVLVATRLSIELALAATVLGVSVGILLGTAPSLLPRPIGRLLTSLVNIAVAFPALLLALFFAVIFGVGTVGGVLAIGLAMAPSFARLTQTLASSVSGRDFVAAAKVAGVGRVRLLTRHILPNIGEPLVINATIGAGGALLAFAGLSFLGIGVQAPAYDWGRLLNQGLSGIYLNPAAALGPGVAVVVAGLAFNLAGETAAAMVGQRVGKRRTTPPRRSRPSQTGAEGGTAEARPDEELLVVENLRIAFPRPGGWVAPVRGVSFTVQCGEAVGVVGESGSGKSLTALGVARLIEAPGSVTAVRLDFSGTPLLTTSDRELRGLLGTSLAMVFQDPMTSFNPARQIGRQLAEVSQQHQGMSRRAAYARAVDRLHAVRIPDAGARGKQYPHEFSGGMRQRAMIGMGLMGDPQLIIADEPTTALDVTVQQQVLQLLAQVRAERRAAILLISHDLAVISQNCDRILVMYAGRIVEDLPATAPLAPRHPYTSALLRSVPQLHTDPEQRMAVIPGRPPEPDQVPAGCPYAARCASADEQCRREEPVLVRLGTAHRVACWHPVAESESATGINLAKELS